MALTPRHRWIVQKLVESFGPAVSEAESEAFLRQDEVLHAFNELFKSSGPQQLLVFYQSPVAKNKVRFVSMCNLKPFAIPDFPYQDWRLCFVRRSTCIGAYQWRRH